MNTDSKKLQNRLRSFRATPKRPKSVLLLFPGSFSEATIDMGMKSTPLEPLWPRLFAQSGR